MSSYNIKNKQTIQISGLILQYCSATTLYRRLTYPIRAKNNPGRCNAWRRQLNIVLFLLIQTNKTKAIIKYENKYSHLHGYLIYLHGCMYTIILISISIHYGVLSHYWKYIFCENSNVRGFIWSSSALHNFLRCHLFRTFPPLNHHEFGKW